MPVVKRYISRDLQSACTVFQSQVVVVAPFVILPRLTGSHQAEPIALRLQCPDTDDGIHLSVILGSRSNNNIYTLDVNRLELFQFDGIMYFFIIDIDFGLSFGQHIELAIATLLNHW